MGSKRCSAGRNGAAPLLIYRKQMGSREGSFLASGLTAVKFRIKLIEVLGIQFFLCQTKGLAETLVVDDFSCPQEFDGVINIRIIPCGTQDVVIGRACLLFGSHILVEIRNDITFGLELAGIEWYAACCLWPESERVVDVVGTEAGVFDFLHAKVAGQLMDNGTDHLEMPQLVST